MIETASLAGAALGLVTARSRVARTNLSRVVRCWRGSRGARRDGDHVEPRLAHPNLLLLDNFGPSRGAIGQRSSPTSLLRALPLAPREAYLGKGGSFPGALSARWRLQPTHGRGSPAVLQPLSDWPCDTDNFFLWVTHTESFP